MQVAVYDTYVKKKAGGLMHFDIIVPKVEVQEKVLQFGREYLKAVGQDGQPLTTSECRFCHVEEADPEMEAEIKKKGCFILEMEGC